MIVYLAGGGGGLRVESLGGLDSEGLRRLWFEGSG